MREAAAEAPQPDVGEIERMQRAVEQMRVAKAHMQSAGAGRLGRLHRHREDFSVGGFGVASTIALKAALRRFSALARTRPEDRPKIAILRLPPGLRRGEIGEADRNRVIGAQTKLGAVSVARQIEPPADILARHVEKHRSRLQYRRLDAIEPGLDQPAKRARAGPVVGRIRLKRVWQGLIQGSIFSNLDRFLAICRLL